MQLKQFKTVVAIFLLLSVCFVNTLEAQRLDKRLQKKDERDFRAPLRSAFAPDKPDRDLKPTQPFGLEFQPQPLEAAIDPNEYIVGPGDVLQISIWFAKDATFQTAVVAEGKLIIPTIGTLDVANKKLIEVQRMIKEAGADKYHSKITADLVFLRKFRVHVTGQVVKPGLYEAMAVERVSDLLKEAQGLTSLASDRSIEVRHRDGSVAIADLYKYNKLGILDANPVLRDGDVIFVPAIQFSNATVRIEGPVNDPGVYQLSENETVNEFLLRVDAYNRRADLRNAYVVRKTMTNSGARKIPIFPYLTNQANGQGEFYLQDQDVVMVPQRLEEVYVVGAVRSPGPYAYYPNLTALDYVGFAGSTERAAGLSKIKVIRQETGKKEKGQDVPIRPGDTIFIPQKVEFGVREITALIVTITNVLITLKALDVL